MSLTVTNLSRSYSTRSGPLPVLRGISLTLEPGQAVAVMGPSGSGKSTLLNILGTLDRPTSGTVQLDRQDPFQLDEAALAAFRNERIGFVFQDHHLLPQCSVLENTLIPTLVQRTSTIPAAMRACEILGQVGLTQRLDHRPAELSGGERQRVAIARAMINQPQLLLADEPTGNLDRHTAQSIGSLLLDLARQRGTILIVVTHSGELAERFPTRFEMQEGTLQAV